MTQPIPVPAEQFDALVAGLDEPDEAPGLEALAATPRRYERTDQPCPDWCTGDCTDEETAK
jgi:hypothetical protein